jgi:uncharacterized membrane protein
MAIVITILVLELRVPPHEPGRLLAALPSMWPSVVAFLVSFMRVSVIWLNHHGLFARIRRVDRTFLWLNLAILLNCMIIPFPTAILADALRAGDPADLRVATIAYTLLAALQSAAWIPVFPYLRDHLDLAEPNVEAVAFHNQRLRPWIGVGIDVAAAMAGIMFPATALTLWTLSLIFFAVTSDGAEVIAPLIRLRRGRRPMASA